MNKCLLLDFKQLLYQYEKNRFTNHSFIKN